MLARPTTRGRTLRKWDFRSDLLGEAEGLYQRQGAGALAPDDVQAAGKKTPGGKLDEPERRNSTEGFGSPFFCSGTVSRMRVGVFFCGFDDTLPK